MADHSKIEWTDATWTPIRARSMLASCGSSAGKVGWHCEHVSEGCRNCYAEAMNKRLGTGLTFKPAPLDNGIVELFLDETMLLAPLRWTKPRMIFVCSMTDLFARFVPDDFIDRMFAVMALCPQHTFQVLTKRGARMRDYMMAPERKRTIGARVMCISEMLARHGGCEARIKLDHFSACFAGSGPFPNIWLGVSAERQPEADERIPDLLATPAAVRFISAEPLLGPIDLTQLPFKKSCDCPDHSPTLNAFDASVMCDGCCEGPERMDLGKIDWVIVGGESGPAARSMHPAWARALRDQCAAARVPFFFKQWGEWAPSTPEQATNNPRAGWQASKAHPHVAKAAELYPEAGAAYVARIGKKAAGRLLDGVEHNAMPEVRS